EEKDPNLRKKIINNFVEGRTDGLLAIKVLDEGIDIPEIRTAYILASSTNRRQFIQRRGRVLRKIDGIDKVAKIYDLIVIPPENDSNAAKKLIEKELNRVEQMSSKALNKEDIDIFIKERLTK
ncbi:helicase-related protein, partial [Gammaproteobacteria bacterium]|nr:helicase-related protein [Gammaproteobacteria bacterium]